VLLILQCVVAPLPSEPLMVAAGFVYGARIGFGISWISVVLGASACFGLSRRLGRPFASRFVSPAHLATLDTYAGERGRAATFLLVLSLRLFAFTSFDIVSYACGLIGFPFRWFLLATAIGALPKVFAFTYFGANVGGRLWWVDAAILTGMFGILLVPWIGRRWRCQRARSTCS
jgi:uncharacterized membrane protein YdjX (TVP38/TMEM64 family)